MLIEKRLNDILKLVEERNSITVQELTQLLNTSESTIRRDLTVLDQKGLLKKVHGGATVLSMGYSTKDDDYGNRENMNKDEKTLIAKYAASLIGENDFVYLDAGTTTERMIGFIETTKPVFVTNAIGHAKKLAQKGCKVYILGGEFKNATEAIVGSEALHSLEKYHFTKCFIGTNGVSVKTGFSTPDLNEAQVKERAMEQSLERYVLCDGSKFSKVSPVTFGEFHHSIIITSMISDESYRNYTNIVEVSKL